LLPVHEALLGRRTFALWEQLEALPSPSREQLRQLQGSGLGRLVEHARAHVPYWRDRLAGCPAIPEEGDLAAALAGVPVLTRAEIARNREAMRWREAPGKILIHRSGGTTDDNLTFYWGRRRQSWDRAMRYRGLARHGIFPGDRILHLWPRYRARALGEQLRAWLRDIRDRLTCDEIIDLRPFSAARLDLVLQACAAYRPVLLIGYPSWLALLAERVRAAHPRFRLPGLRLVLSTGEVLFGFQRRLIEETFGVRVAQEYGSQDAGLVAHEDPAGVLRLNAEQMLVEVLRDGRTASPGELGEVVVTHFASEVMPFIRYATGDVVRQIGNSPEASGLPVFPLPEGRTSDVLAATDGAPCPMRPVVEALVEHAGFREFSLYQPEAERLVFLEVVGGMGRPCRATAEEVLRSFLGVDLQVEWRQGRGFVPFTSGKRRFVCSPAGMQLVAHDRESGLARARAWPQRLLGLQNADCGWEGAIRNPLEQAPEL
jgi:phenylacetate-CoA ligase